MISFAFGEPGIGVGLSGGRCIICESVVFDSYQVVGYAVIVGVVVEGGDSAFAGSVEYLESQQGEVGNAAIGQFYQYFGKIADHPDVAEMGIAGNGVHIRTAPVGHICVIRYQVVDKRGFIHWCEISVHGPVQSLVGCTEGNELDVAVPLCFSGELHMEGISAYAGIVGECGIRIGLGRTRTGRSHLAEDVTVVKDGNIEFGDGYLAHFAEGLGYPAGFPFRKVQRAADEQLPVCGSVVRLCDFLPDAGNERQGKEQESVSKISQCVRHILKGN